MNDYYMSERLPRRHKWFKAAYFQTAACIICMISIVGIPIGLLLSFTSLFTIAMQLRYPVIKVTCPRCKTTLKVEPDVQKFHCVCLHLLEKDGSNYIESPDF
ncbi:hypothetical protein [Marininema halotolerans]|uniref:Uncharacterized protein n=1 Tax=Marininema halotolerans TaxID=1155944 RepID=A0A1I6SFZ3_9BACL|nr:hypothetical protein [Marininema halotolerans]SFS75895.1 hypothetical protein SAMN05444972_10760 [Marininema halotolerans]